jgi:hypothetical protein
MKKTGANKTIKKPGRGGVGGEGIGPGGHGKGPAKKAQKPAAKKAEA